MSDVTLHVMQGDVQFETDNVETKSVYLLLNLDGTLPLTGTRSNSFFVVEKKSIFSTLVAVRFDLNVCRVVLN